MIWLLKWLLLFLLQYFCCNIEFQSCGQSIAIAKELYELPYVRADVTRHLSEQLEATLTDPPPPSFAKQHYCQKEGRLISAEVRVVHDRYEL